MKLSQHTFIYYINTSEIPSELSRENFLSSQVKITCYLHTWRDHHRYGYIIKRASFAVVYMYKQNIICPLVDMNFIFSCSARYLSHEWVQRTSEIPPAYNILYISTFCKKSKPLHMSTFHSELVLVDFWTTAHRLFNVVFAITTFLYDVTTPCVAPRQSNQNFLMMK